MPVQLGDTESRPGALDPSVPFVSQDARSVGQLVAAVQSGFGRLSAISIIPWSAGLTQEVAEPIVAGPLARRPVWIKVTSRRRVTSARYAEPMLDE